MRKLYVIVAIIAMLCLCVFAQAGTTVVYSNNAAGDDFTNAGGSNTNPATPGAALGSTGWYYNNVRNNGHVGVNTEYARSGNGSVWFEGTQGPTGSSSKGDIEYYSYGASGTLQSLGTLGTLSSFKYDWYRSSGGSAGVDLHPVFRLWVANTARDKMGYLIFEMSYNKDRLASPAICDTWVSTDVLSGDYRLWSTHSLPDVGVTAASKRLSEWQSLYGNYDVLGVSAGFGSGWGTFEGAIDNVTFGFNGVNTTYNFETASSPAAVPEPATLLGFGIPMLMVGLGKLKRIRH